MYRILKDNRYTFLHCAQYKLLGLFWIVTMYGSLEECRVHIAKRTLPRSERYTIVE